MLRGVLLIYHRDDLSDIAHPMLEKLQALHVTSKDDSTTIMNNDDDPLLLVGRRLRVLWKGDMFYCGTVTAYEADTGKHAVTYDDGDVRLYRLAEKTMEWLDDSPQSDHAHSTDKRRSNDPSGWVGRRLRVRWKCGTYYAGHVTAYDPNTGKHTVTYDDGDVRDYRLAQKSFEWILPDCGDSD